MSNIGKKAINIPVGVTINFLNEKLIVNGKYGILEVKILNGLSLSINDNKIILTCVNNGRIYRAYHGLVRSLIQNSIIGVHEKYVKILIIEGVGYKFQISEVYLTIAVGFTHSVKMLIPTDINVKLESPTKLVITGIDKIKIGDFAARVRSVRPPEPYKGKGISYEGEKIIRKAGKTGRIGKNAKTVKTTK